MDDENAHGRTVHAMGERVAVVETKIVSLKEDTAVIRTTLHGINGEMQKFVLQEARCVAALEAIIEQTKHLPDLASKMIAFEEMRPRLVGLLNNDHRRRGAWRASIMIGSVVTGAVAVLGTLATGFVWLIDRLIGHSG